MDSRTSIRGDQGEDSPQAIPTRLAGPTQTSYDHPWEFLGQVTGSHRMKLAFATVLTILSAGALANGQDVKVAPGIDPQKSIVPSLVRIEIYDDSDNSLGSGGGFIVDSSGTIVTNYHVIQHAKHATVRLANNDAYDDVSVLDVDKRKDIAIIKIKAIGLPSLRIGSSSAVQVGDLIYVVCSWDGKDGPSWAQETVSSIYQADGYHLFQLAPLIQANSTGIPVFNSKGDVVGILDRTLDAEQNQLLAIPIDYGAGMLASASEPKPLQSIYEPVEKTLGAPLDGNSKEEVHARPSSELVADPIRYFGTKVGSWEFGDAETELGAPTARRDAVQFPLSTVIGDIYKYGSPSPQFRYIELNFSRDTRKLVAAYCTLQDVVSWSSIRKQMGKKYKEAILHNGRPAYTYQVLDREITYYIDSYGNVVTISIY